MDTTFSRNDQRAIVAEFLGTLFFVFLGTGAVVAATEVFPGSDGGTLVAIALAHGIGILTAVAWTANISGGHINPGAFWLWWKSFGDDSLEPAPLTAPEAPAVRESTA